jgi:hypothetical protein
MTAAEFILDAMRRNYEAFKGSGTGSMHPQEALIETKSFNIIL